MITGSVTTSKPSFKFNAGISIPGDQRNYCPMFLFPFIEKLWNSIYGREVHFLSSVLLIACIRFELSARHPNQSDSPLHHSPTFALVAATDLHVAKFKGKFSILSLLEGVLTELLILSYKHFLHLSSRSPLVFLLPPFSPFPSLPRWYLLFFVNSYCWRACSLSVLTSLVSSSRIKVLNTICVTTIPNNVYLYITYAAGTTRSCIANCLLVNHPDG